jgi:hypothetical protein
LLFFLYLRTCYYYTVIFSIVTCDIKNFKQNICILLINSPQASLVKRYMKLIIFLSELFSFLSDYFVGKLVIPSRYRWFQEVIHVQTYVKPANLLEKQWCDFFI